MTIDDATLNGCVDDGGEVLIYCYRIWGLADPALEAAMASRATNGEIAKALGTSAQPVGQACGGNPIPIVIPCHRVVSATGLGGFSGAGGVETKIALLRLEGGFRFLL